MPISSGVVSGKKCVARAKININALIAQVWNALVDLAAIQKYYFGTHVISDWKAGSPIVWNGFWEGKAYEDKGTIFKIEPGHLMQYSHFSPLSGAADKPENYHTVTVVLSKDRDETQVELTQDNNASEDEGVHSQQNWEVMLARLKNLIEQA